MMVAGRAGGIAPLLDAIFSFLYRKTDFYHIMQEGENMGFPPGMAEKLVLSHFHKYEKLAVEARATHAKGGAKAALPPAPNAAAPSAPAPAPAPTAGAAAAAPRPAVLLAAAAAAVPLAVPLAARTIDSRDLAAAVTGNSHLPAAVALESTYNGGQTDVYVWEQTVGDVTITVPLPPGTRAKDIVCTIGRRHLTLAVKGAAAPVLDADYPCDDRNNQKVWERVKLDSCFWNLVDGKCQIYLEKERECWWKSALHGDVEIDTTKVDSVKHVQDYDGETQGAIRKIMFDQEQKRKGLPTSDELAQQDVLKQAWDAEGSPFKGTPFNPSLIGNAADPAGAIPGMPVPSDEPAGPERPRNAELPDE